MSNQNNIPDFFIVGAPKCGTTALDYHINLHPDIYMAKKEIHYFGSDLVINQAPLNEKEYLNYFNKAEQNQLKGESSVWYLFSEKAAQEIKSFNPDAKIIILLRKPTEMIPSLHAQYIYNADEDITDFETAFFKDLKRDKLSSFSFKNRPKYIDACLYYKQVKRYLDIFDNQNVMVILHEDLSTNFTSTLDKVFNFLEIKPSIEIKQQQINNRKNIKNSKLHKLSKSPSKNQKNIFRFIIPFKPVRHLLMKTVQSINISTKKTSPSSLKVKQQIQLLTQNDIKQLEILINKNLSSWLN